MSSTHMTNRLTTEISKTPPLGSLARGEGAIEPQPPQVSTLSVHGGEARQKPGNSITDPIFCASTYTFENSQAVIDFIENEQPREEYGRYGNPGERVAERNWRRSKGARWPCCIPAAWRPSWGC